LVADAATYWRERRAPVDRHGKAEAAALSETTTTAGRAAATTTGPSDGVGEAVALKGWMKSELVWIIAAIIVILVLAAIGYLARLA
jgi:hypothetical protein